MNWGIIHRELILAGRQRSELLQPVIFFVLVVSLFPLAMGPETNLLTQIAPGIIWIAALLSCLLGLERLFRQDFVSGVLEQCQLASIPMWQLVLAKITMHWLFTIVPLMLVSPLLAVFLHISANVYWVVVLTLLLGTPILSLIGAIAVALTLNLQRGGVLLSLLLLPIFIPLLIFSTSAVQAAQMSLSFLPQLAIIAAMLCVALILAPWATCYAIKVSQN